jgi:hypothetical protein
MVSGLSQRRERMIKDLKITLEVIDKATDRMRIPFYKFAFEYLMFMDMRRDGWD